MDNLTKYKNPEERSISVPLSMKNSLLSELEASAADFSTDRSKLMQALARYCIKKKNNKLFIKEIRGFLNGET